MGKTVKPKHLRSLALSIVALCASASAAMALDTADFAKKLTAVYSFSLPPGGSVNFGTATVSGNSVTYDGLTVVVPGATDGPFKIDTKLTFNGVQAQPDGSYVADSLSFPDVDYKFDGGELTAKNFAFKHLYVPSGKTQGTLDSTRLFGDASVGPIALSIDGTPAFSVDSVTVTNNFKPSQADANPTEIDSTGVTSGLKFDMTGAKDQDAIAAAKALALLTVTGKALESLTWTLKDGHFNLSELSVDFDKIGKFKFGVDFTGYTPALLDSISSMMKTMSGPNAGSMDQSQQTAMLLGAMQTLFLNSASLRFDDASITSKLLDMGAQQAGVAKPAFIDQLVASVPAQMNEGNSDPLPQTVVQTAQAAVRAYLTDPHSFEVRLAPKTPLGVLGMVAAAMQPNNLQQQIGFEMLVNDKEITAADAAKETGVAPPAADSSTAPSGDATPAAPPADDQNSTAAPDSSSDGSTAPSDGTDATDQSGDQSGGQSSGHSKTTR